MRSEEFVVVEIDKLLSLVESMAADRQLIETVARCADICTGAIAGGGKIMLCGNGGSAADAQHLAAELIGKLNVQRRALAGLALTTDTSALTAIGNDFGYEFVFSRQVEGIGRPGDVLIGISTSGRSLNVVRAFETARASSIATIALTGRLPSPMSDISDEWIPVPHSETQKIQEAHIMLGHILFGLVESRFLDKPV